MPRDVKKDREGKVMLMAVNVGNSRICFGFFEEDRGELIAKFKIAADLNKTSDEYLALIKAIAREADIPLGNASACILSSVVPQLTSVMVQTLEELTNTQPMTVGPGVKTGFLIKIDSPSELGADIVANTAAIIGEGRENGEKDLSSVVIDMGTVTTVSAINKNGEYVGCSIFPGVGISFDAMHGNTAQLPNVIPESPERAIGKNSRDSVRSGIILGNAMMLDGMCERFAAEMHCDVSRMKLVATGEFAPFIVSACKYEYRYDAELTLKGLWHLYKNNRQAADKT